MLNKAKQKGMTLIEVAVVLLIAGIFFSVTFMGVRGQLEVSKITYTRSNIAIIEDAITAFVATNGRLPCPATPTLAQTSAQYGVEQLNTGTNPATCTITTQVTDGQDITYYGAVPARTLNLPISAMTDGWNNKISYVVQRAFVNNSLTNTTPCSSTTSTAHTSGFICLRGQASGTTPASHLDIWIYSDLTLATLASLRSAAYLLISHGANGLGAFNASGTQNTLPNSSTQLNQLQNTSYCITNTCSATARRFMLSAGNATEANGFDDILAYRTREQLVFDCNKYYDGSCTKNWNIGY